MRLLTDRLFDGQKVRAGTWRLDVEDGRLRAPEEVAPGTGPAPGDFDARGCTVLPGLVNAHVHIARGGAFEADEPPSVRRPALNLRDTLAAGVTTVADLGCPPPMVAALRSHTEHREQAGPAIRCAGALVTAPGGYPLDWLPPLVRRLGAALPCGDEHAAKDAVQRMAQAGMNFIKLAVMHESYGGRPLPALRVEVARAVVAEAHTLGLSVLAHAHSERDYRLALDAGVDALMHSSFEPLTEETLGRIRDRGTPVCPTLWVFESACLAGEEHWHTAGRLDADAPSFLRQSWRRFCEAYAASGEVVPPGIGGGLSKERGKQAVRVASANLVLLKDAGVPIVFGNDAAYGFSRLDRPHEELLAMGRAGMSAPEVLRAATSRAAALLGYDDRGELAAGKRADLLVVDGDATRDLEALRRVRLVLRGGQVAAPSFVREVSAMASVLGGMARTALLALRG